jgi:hypothetical protein
LFRTENIRVLVPITPFFVGIGIHREMHECILFQFMPLKLLAALAARNLRFFTIILFELAYPAASSGECARKIQVACWWVKEAKVPEGSPLSHRRY